MSFRQTPPGRGAMHAAAERQHRRAVKRLDELHQRSQARCFVATVIAVIVVVACVWWCAWGES